MKFSVIVPIYKTEKYLSCCIDSILSQTYRDFEVILVDDGSPDNSPAIIDEYAKNDDRIVVIHKENGGLVSARKAGAEVSLGEYILNVDSDDYVLPDFFEKTAVQIDKYSPDAVAFGFTQFSENGQIKNKQYNAAELGYYGKESISTLISSFLYDTNSRGINGGSVKFNVCAKAVRRELYRECQKLVPNGIVSGEDLLFTMNLLPRLESLVIDNNDSYMYRQNPESIEHTVNLAEFVNFRRLYDEMSKLSEVIFEYGNGVYVYVLDRLWQISIRCAKKSKNYSEYKKFINDENYRFMYSQIDKAFVSKPNIVDKIVVFLLKHRMFHIIYMLSKTYFKNKDM